MKFAACLLLVVGLAAPAAADPTPPDIDALVDAFVTGDASARRTAADALGDRYPEGVAAVPLLLDGLDDDDEAVRASAAKALDALGAHGYARYEAVLGSKEDPAHTSFDRILGVAAQRRVGPLDATAVMDRGNERAVRRGATLAAGLIRGTPGTAEPILDVLVDLLDDDEVGAEAAAALALRGRDAVPGLPGAVAHAYALEAVRSEAPHARFAGARLLSLAGATGPDVVDLLGDALAHDAWGVEAVICDALGRLGPQASAATAALEAVVREEGKARFAAAKALLDVGATERLATLLRVDGAAGRAAAYALSFRHDERVLPVLRAWFEEEGGPTLPPDELLEAMARMGPRLSDLAPRLRGVLGGQIRSGTEAAWTLIAIAPDDDRALDLLFHTIERRVEYRLHPMHFREMLDLLIQLGDRAEPALPTLITILRYGDTGEDRAKGETLRRIALRSHVFDQVRRMQFRAIEVVRNLGLAAAEARPYLERQTRKPDPRIRYRAARALRSVTPPAPEPVPAR